MEFKPEPNLPEGTNLATRICVNCRQEMRAHKYNKFEGQWDCPEVVEVEMVETRIDPEAQCTALEDTYADFITRECAAVGMLHASMASLVPVSQLDALSLDEQEMVQRARDLLHKVHGFVLARADYRKSTLGRLKEVMDGTPG